MPRIPRDDYYVMMWSFIDPLFIEGPEKARRAISRFRELASNSGTLIATFVALDGYKEMLQKLGLPPITFTAREMGCSPFLENGFPFYVENIIRPLYRNWNEFKPIYRAQYETFSRTRNRRVFVSPPCLNDPAVMALTRERIAQVMERLQPARHLSLLYDLRDEPSITSFLLASDSCFCEHCLSRMRDWLKARYGDLERLNAEWGTQFPSWEAVEPITSQEALERREAGCWNFAPWADHRDFMNDIFARACRELAEVIRALDPEARVGLAGTQCPSVFGGYDFSRLVPVLDWAEPYDFGGSLDCVRSFKPRRAFPVLKTSGLGGSNAAVEAMLWTYLFQAGGHAGTIIWNSNTVLDVKSAGLKPAAGARERAKVYAELRSGPPRLLQEAAEMNSPVAVHYSQASINADFIATVPNSWRSVAGSENGEFLARQERDAWWKLLEDRGLRPTFISSQEIEAGHLGKRPIKVLILPRSIALSDAEAAEMKRFVQAGGTLLADSFTGRMDEHCRDRGAGVLDDLFGIRRFEGRGYHHASQRASYSPDVKPGERPRWGSGPRRLSLPVVEDGIEPAADVVIMGSTEMTDTPVGIVAKRGKGKSVLFNAAPVDYLIARRLPNGGGAIQDFFGGFLEAARVRPEAQVFDAATRRPVVGWRVWPFRHGKARYFGLAPDMQVVQDTLGAISVEAREGRPCPVRVKLAARGYIYEVRSGRYLGKGDTVEDELTPTSARLYAVLPYKVRGLSLKIAEGQAVARLRIAGPASAGEHVFRFDVFDAGGRRLLDAGANVVAHRGAAAWKPDPPLPKRGKLVCRDLATGVTAVRDSHLFPRRK